MYSILFSLCKRAFLSFCDGAVCLPLHVWCRLSLDDDDAAISRSRGGALGNVLCSSGPSDSASKWTIIKLDDKPPVYDDGACLRRLIRALVLSLYLLLVL